MSRTPVKHIVAALVGGFIAGCLMLGMLALLNGGGGFASCTAMTGLGWAVPLLAGIVIGGVALMLIEPVGPPDETEAEELTASTCASCGSPIISEWRMCPHCGAMLECDMIVSATTNG